MVADTCTYSIGQLIPKFKTAAVGKLGIKGPLEYLLVYATTLASNFLFIWFLLTVKSQIILVLLDICKIVIVAHTSVNQSYLAETAPFFEGCPPNCYLKNMFHG